VFAAALFLLVRPWGVTGAALAWTVRLAVDAVLQHLVARRSLGAPVVPLALPALSATALAALALASHALGDTAPVARLAAGLVAAAVALRLLPGEDRDALLRALWLAPRRGAA
jgi:hypothetical protein